MSHSSSPSSRDSLERIAPGRLHVLLGGPGSGKTELCLRFVAAGLVAGERTAMLVMSRADDLKAHARRLGFELDDALRLEHLLLLRYAPEFGERRARSSSPSRPVEELAQLLSAVRPSRIVIDSFAPLLGDEPGSGHAVAALATYLDGSGATSLLTYPEDLSAGYDRRLEPIMQSAAAIFRLERRSRDRVDLHAITTRVGVEPVARPDAAITTTALTS